MNNVSNYNIGNSYNSYTGNVNFKAKLAPELEKKISADLKPDFGQKYISRLKRRLEKFPDVTIEDVLEKSDGTYVRMAYNSNSQCALVSSSKLSAVDTIEALLSKKEQAGTADLASCIFRMFNI
jgi:hypothetical protein